MQLDYKKIQAVHGALAEVTQAIDTAAHAVADGNVGEAVEAMDKARVGIDRASEDVLNS